MKGFFNAALKPNDRSITEPIKCIVHSFSSDLVHGVTRGKVITSTHFLLGVGLHNLPGLKTPIKILSKLEHCINYDLVCEVETAEELALKCTEDGHGIQPLQPSNENASLLTFWWAGNFNQTLETQTGKGQINSTHIVEFSERSENSCYVTTLSTPKWSKIATGSWTTNKHR